MSQVLGIVPRLGTASAAGSEHEKSFESSLLRVSIS